MTSGEILPAESAPAYALDREIKRELAHMRTLWLSLAEKLHEFHGTRAWKALGYSSLEQWLADPAVEINRRTCFALIEIWQQYVIERGIEPLRLGQIPVSKVREVLPAIRSGQVDLEVALSDAEVLSRPDLQIRYRGLASGRRGVPDTDSTIRTEHEPVPMVRCERCNGRGLVPVGSDNGRHG